MHNPKKKFVDDVTIVSADFLNTLQGGDDSASPTDPAFAGHKHDLPPGVMGSEWGHVTQIDLTTDVSGRLTLPSPELKSIKLSATQAASLTSSLFWTVPIPNDAYTTTPQPMFLNIFWTANGATTPANAAFRVDWEYIQLNQNVMPPSIIDRGSSAWPTNTLSANNPLTSTFRFKSSVSSSTLNVNDPNSPNTGKVIQLTLPSNVPNATLANFMLLGLEITSAPTVTLSQAASQVSMFAIELLYYSSTMGVNTAPVLLSNDPGLSDF